ncbi:MAG: ABC transporter ATP-binding protein [Deltaproteobacteria bacterium]|nr:MAG: ABC transporter ATP-binding protein [Deltaproteobacteria bacterium]
MEVLGRRRVRVARQDVVGRRVPPDVPRRIHHRTGDHPVDVQRHRRPAGARRPPAGAHRVAVAAPLVEIRGLSKKYYGHPVLAGVSFDIAEGEVFGCIGPNGAGKTTTLKILAGLITEYQGQVQIAGADIARDRVRSHHLIGFLPQGVGFQAWRTVDSALDSLAELSGVAAEVRARRIPEMLERFDLLAARHKKVKELSGGMTQKLGLIQALLHEPRLLVLDEPLEGLDPPSRALLKDVIRERQRAGTTVLFSSHILSDVEDVADRVGILNAGAIATSGSLRELLVAFGRPLEIELAWAAAPADPAFVHELGAASERKPGVWRVRLPDGADPDAAVHAAIERTLAGGGRLRRIGLVEPELDELFASYLSRAAPVPAPIEDRGRHVA